jgi:hypothetical protein
VDGEMHDARTETSSSFPCASLPVGVTTVFGRYGTCSSAFSTRNVDTRSTKKIQSCREVVLSRRIVYMPCLMINPSPPLRQA